MKSAKVPNWTTLRYPLAVYVSPSEEKIINDYFNSHPHLKKGETVKSWILKSIEGEIEKEALNE